MIRSDSIFQGGKKPVPPKTAFRYRGKKGFDNLSLPFLYSSLLFGLWALRSVGKHLPLDWIPLPEHVGLQIGLGALLLSFFCFPLRHCMVPTAYYVWRFFTYPKTICGSRHEIRPRTVAHDIALGILANTSAQAEERRLQKRLQAEAQARIQ